MAIGIIIYFILVVMAVVGWFMNVYKAIAECDYVAPYKCEVVRVVGIPFAPVGVIAGWLELE